MIHTFPGMRHTFPGMKQTFLDMRHTFLGMKLCYQIEYRNKLLILRTSSSTLMRVVGRINGDILDPYYATIE